MKTKTKKGNLIIFRLALTAIILVSAFALFPSETAEAAPNLVPAMPTNLQASDGTYTDKVYITWSFTPVSGQYVELWRSTSTASAGTHIVSKSEFMYHNDTTATIGVTYYYRVRACDGNVCTNYTAWNSGWRGLETPTNFTASDGSYTSSVGMAWNAVTGATKYEIRRAETINGTKVYVGETTNTFYFDQTAPPKKSLYYFVRACTTSVQCSAYSTPDSGWREWPTVQNIQASDGTQNGFIRVTWDAIQGVDYYKVHYQPTPVGNYFNHADAYSNTIDIIPPAIYTRYLYMQWQFSVEACVTGVGCSGIGDSPTDPVTPDTGYGKPNIPTNLQADKGIDTTGVSLTWDAVEEDVVNIVDVRYLVYRGTNANGTGRQNIGSAVFANYSDTTAVPGVKYYYWLESCDNENLQNCSGISTSSDWGWRNFTVVTNLSASKGTSSYVQLNWDSKAGATSYKVYRATDSQGPYLYLSTPTTNSYQDSSALEGVMYYYKAEACGSDYCSGNSNNSPADNGYVLPSGCYALDVNHNTRYADTPAYSPNKSLGCTDFYTYVSGENITVTAKPKTGWKVNTWSGTNNDSSTANTNTVTIGASNKTISLTYTPTTCYTLTLSHTGQGANPVADLSNSLGCAAGKYGPGEIFGVDASPGPDAGWYITDWTGTRLPDEGSPSSEVLMPAANHSVGINYVAYCYDVTFSHTGQGSDPVPSPANSTGCATGKYKYGEVISLTATPATGWDVLNWSSTTDNPSSTSTTNAATVEGDMNVNVAYKQACYTLTRSHTGNGSDAFISPDSSIGCSLSTFHMGEIISLVAYPDTGNQVSSWSGTSDDSSISTNNSVTMPASNHTVTVNFEQACYSLTLGHIGQGGDPVAKPANSTGCPAGKYHYNETITLTASPADGWYISYWTPTSPATGPNQTEINMGSVNKTVSVTYEADCHNLDLNSGVNGQNPTAVPTASNGCSTGWYYPGEVISLTAHPDPGYKVGSWSGTDNNSSTSNTNVLTMPNANHAVNVTYVEGSTEPTFGDVPDTYPYYNEIEILYANGYTGGCSTSPLLFCPDVSMSRAQSAVFMLRGNFGNTYVPVTPTHFFADNWKNSSWGEGWAESMYLEGLTAGCSPSPLKFCPDEILTNVQLAVFGLRLKHGMSYPTPTATGTVFADMTDTGFWGTGWAEQAYAEGLIPSCGTDSGTGKPKFCPNNLVSRGFGASVIVNAKNLTMP